MQYKKTIHNSFYCTFFIFYCVRRAKWKRSWERKCLSTSSKFFF